VLIISVVLAGVSAWGYVMRGRSLEYASRAAKHDYSRRSFERNLYQVTHNDDGTLRENFTRDERDVIAYFESMARQEGNADDKYRYAARFPWFSVDPDPPHHFFAEAVFERAARGIARLSFLRSARRDDNLGRSRLPQRTAP
jgi:hypothetical protein